MTQKPGGTEKTAMSQFDKYLSRLRATREESSSSTNHTHTRIGSKADNIFGGVYTIEDQNIDEFYKKYHEHDFWQ